ncbi:hypothetical protein HDZ31DRAFT_71564 [Schizophyllum fasciatum]
MSVKLRQKKKSIEPELTESESKEESETEDEAEEADSSKAAVASKQSGGRHSASKTNKRVVLEESSDVEEALEIGDNVEAGSAASSDDLEPASDDDMAALREKLARSNARRKQHGAYNTVGGMHKPRKDGKREYPRTTASIQTKMGLPGGKDSQNYHTYLGIRAREKIPLLAQYKNDWATIAIARQFCKNRRSAAYRSGALERPAEYAYLKANAAKRTSTGSRRKRSFVEAEEAASKKKKSKTGPSGEVVTRKSTSRKDKTKKVAAAVASPPADGSQEA